MVKELLPMLGFEDCPEDFFKKTDPAGAVYRLKLSKIAIKKH
jgi:hypothetical protein